MKYLATYESFNTSTKLPTIEEVNKSLKDLKEIGEGGNAIVYNINDNFVVRVIKRTSKVEMTEKINNINPVSVFPGYNFGQIVANTDIKSITILKKQNGTPIEDKTTSVEQYIENIKKASNLPQETFDNFVKDVVYLEENNYMIDPSKSNNFLIDCDDKKINIVDIAESSSSNSSGFREFFIPLVSTPFINVKHNLIGDEDLIPYWKGIESKLINACKKYNKYDSKDVQAMQWIYKKKEIVVTM
jgi:hypothetical protein